MYADFSTCGKQRKCPIWILCITAVLLSTVSEIQALEWRTERSGLSLATQAVPIPGTSASDTIHIVRLEAGKWRFEPCYFRTHSGDQRLNASEWLALTGATLVINAGQYDTSFQHLGWFIRDSKNLGTRKHPLWKGLFANKQPSGSGHPDLTIIDLQTTPLSIDSMTFSNAVQSLMLFDERGIIRVNRSGNTARRCVIAEGRDRKIYIFITEGEWTLWKLAEYLMSSGLKLRHAMSMDGGAQAQIAIKSQLMELTVPRFQMALPCVISFYPSGK